MLEHFCVKRPDLEKTTFLSPLIFPGQNAVLHSPRFSDSPPSRISVSALTDDYVRLPPTQGFQPMIRGYPSATRPIYPSAARDAEP